MSSSSSSSSLSLTIYLFENDLDTIINNIDYTSTDPDCRIILAVYRTEKEDNYIRRLCLFEQEFSNVAELIMKATVRWPEFLRYIQDTTKRLNGFTSDVPILIGFNGLRMKNPPPSNMIMGKELIEWLYESAALDRFTNEEIAQNLSLLTDQDIRPEKIEEWIRHLGCMTEWTDEWDTDIYQLCCTKPLVGKRKMTDVSDAFASKHSVYIPPYDIWKRLQFLNKHKSTIYKDIEKLYNVNFYRHIEWNDDMVRHYQELEVLNTDANGKTDYNVIRQILEEESSNDIWHGLLFDIDKRNAWSSRVRTMRTKPKLINVNVNENAGESESGTEDMPPLPRRTKRKADTSSSSTSSSSSSSSSSNVNPIILITAKENIEAMKRELGQR